MAQLKITLKNVIESQQAIQNLLPQKLSPRVAYWLAKASRVIMDEGKNFDAARLSLLDKSFEKSEDGTRYDIPEDKRAGFQKEFDELLSTEIEVSLRQLTLDELKGVEISVLDMMTIEWLIIDEPQPVQDNEIKPGS